MKSNSTKIIFTVTNDLNYDQRMQRICSSLQNHGFESLLIGRKRSNSGKITSQIFQQKRLTGLFAKGPLFYMEFNLRLFFYLLVSKFDVVCGIDLDTLPAAWLAAKVRGKKCVYDAHEYFPESPELEGRKTVKSIWQKIERFLLPKVDAAYTVSNGIKEIFEKTYNREIGLVRNMPFSSSIKKSENEKKYILYQGALNVGRGLEALIEIAPKLNAALWLAGEGDLSDDLRNQAESISAKVKFLGRLNPKELKTITVNASVGINLLEPMGESYYLSLSNKFFDYVMAEIPQVCINFPEYNTLNKEYKVAVLVDNLNKEILINSINELLENQTKRMLLIENCIAAKQVWNWENETKNLVKIYQALA